MKQILQTLKSLCQVSLLVAALGMSINVSANEGGFPLDAAPNRVSNNASLQNGAKLFVNYCFGCHSATSVRYNRMRDIGLTDQQIKDNLILTDAKVGDLMTIAMSPKDAKVWFGKVPPDLSVEARARGTDWLYTYLRTFYKDDERPTGWNNLVYPNVGMPHVLWQLQGQRAAKFEERKDPHDESRTEKVFVGFEQLTPGTMSVQDYDDNIADLVSFMSWMAEPVQLERKRLGVIVLLFLAVFTLFAWRLNKAYWKDIH
ncbi:cytochrome c1 [Polynucleobacter paneuropaeus]|jgi:ubiquinol-cytochrome c reductase cytochrome c1 subunit|uniref:Cytochrome c1 n=1 Tax=Polynucleobacter paneuropaeus TaxID=2527775 RepID=A0A9Q2ZWJ4_9BURK|nr:cytochrome c1 [Polynucleobacter paneuropaeus]AWW47289.1 cytochrome c1 [Polynucleobacter paneuropaeus]MBT8515093.1 cytochrome c1 [Polynucleobacter paneuropaeus]MBT8520190.1 cytochrome c1 [Polynucleobacter paneuropaeus]MBT8521900.1 cytochrome c1 [Polynucleobacter paneuropaeus]MBT8530712.1 cytochrome c1 [Polynucleobacter paneuropaeus]